MYDVIVIGGGPAGLTAATYAARAGNSVFIVEQNAFGGQIATSPRVENYPAVPNVTGAELAERMFGQAVDEGAQFDMGTATVRKVNDDFVVRTEYDEFWAHSVVLATGVTHKKLGVDGEQLAGVCYCAVCDGAFYKGRSVCVVGDGNSAVQYALYLAEICSNVTLVTLTDRLFCDKELELRLPQCDNVERLSGVQVTEILGTDKVQGLVCRDGDGAITYLDCEAVFVAIGQQPHNEAFAELVQLDEQGYIVAGEDCHTSCDGVFAAGDCRTKTVRQCATAVGDGAVAGHYAAAYVDALKRTKSLK